MANVWQKAFQRIFWKNRPSTDTPIGESKLLPMDASIDTIDDRVVTLQSTKAEQSDFLTALKNIQYNPSTGVFTITKFNDSSFTIDTDIEKIAINFDYDDDPTSAHYQQLIITLDDGTVKYVDLSALITEYEFGNTSTINFTVSGSTGIVTANIINGSITSDHLAPSVTAAINAAVNSAEAHAKDSEAWARGTKDGTPVPSTADQYQNNSKYYSELSEDSAEDSEAYAKGTRNGTAVSSDDPAYHNNAKYWSEQAVATLNNKVDKEAGKGLSSNDFTDALKDKLDGIETGAEVNVQSDWNQTTTTAKDYIKNKPSLATVATSGSYNDLSNKPTIPTVNNATLTIKQDGTSKGTFTANASSNVTIELTDNNTWTAMVGATSSANGSVGYVNAVPPKDGYNTKYLRADGTWTVPPNDNTDTKVTQTATSTNANYEVLFSATADNTTRTEAARKDTGLTFNPSTDTLSTKYLNHKALKALTGSGTAGSDAGASVSPRYTPSLWTFNAGVTVANGEVYLIKIPVAGGTYGVWLSLNNGTNYYPVAVSNGKGRFTTQYAANTVIAVTYESAGVCTCYARTGADATADVTGIFRVLNDYDANTTYSNMSANELTTGTATTARSISAKVLTDWLTGKLSTKVSDNPTFTEASTRANIASGESFATILGKIKKFFTDLKTVAFSGASADVTYGSGSVKDALDSLRFPRQKNLGAFTSQAQLETFLSNCGVSTGKFDGDIQIGDYVTIAGYKCYVAGFDTEYNKGDTELTTHHITFLANFGNSKMNATNTTAGGYEGATTMQSFLSSKETELTAICGSHLLSRKALTTNAVTNGKSSSWAWNTHKLTLMSETQIYGSIQWGNVYDTGEGYEKLPIFNCLTPLQVFGRTGVWLCGIFSAADFCRSGHDGSPYFRNASSSLAAVALFCIG